MKSFFRSSNEETAKVRSILARLEHRLLKPLLHFLIHIMCAMHRFNRVFQKCSENTTCQLYTEMCRLEKLFVFYLLKPEAITAASDNLSLLNLSHENQLPDENLGIGTETWRSLVELEAEQELKPFFCAVRKFFIASITKMLKNFHLAIPSLKTWEFFNLTKQHLTPLIPSSA